MFVRDVRVYTCKRVLYTISYRVHVYQIYMIGAYVGVGIRGGVGPVEFQLYCSTLLLKSNQVNSLWIYRATSPLRIEPMVFEHLSIML